MNTFSDFSNSREGRSDKNTTQVFCQELCLIYLPYSTSPVLPKLCQSIFAHGYTPVAVSSVGETLIHSRQAKFAVIILPDNDVELINKVRDPGGLNSSTPVVVISPTDSFPESTLHLLEHQLIQEVVVKSTDVEKFEGDLVYAMNRVVHSSSDTEDIFSSFLPLQPRMTVPEAPHPVTSCSPPSQEAMAYSNMKQKPDSGTFIDMKVQSEAPLNDVPQGPLFGFPMMYPFGPTSQGSELARSGLLETMKTDQEKMTFGKGIIEQNTVPSFLTTPFFHPLAQASPTPSGRDFYREPGAVQGDLRGAESRGVGLLPGIETLLDAIQVREAQNAVQKTLGAEQELSGYTNTENIRKPLANKDLPGKTPRLCAIASEADVEPGDEKSPLSVAVQRPYFLTLDELKEKMADDPSVRAVDRHNAKERHRRVRISKASEFFKAVVPCMKESMDKATVFYLTTHYLLFLRNALNRQDPSILPKLHKTFKQEWRGVFNMELAGPE